MSYAYILVIGIILMIVSLYNVWKLIREVFFQSFKKDLYILFIFVLVFLLGYMVYLYNLIFYDHSGHLHDGVAVGIFVFGSIFVFFVAHMLSKFVGKIEAQKVYSKKE